MITDQFPLNPPINSSQKLNSRKNFWKAVYNTFHEDNPSLISHLNTKELKNLELLSNGSKWFDFIPNEWIDIYSALFDESKSFKLDDEIDRKISKDVNRTFSIFDKNVQSLGLRFRMNISEYPQSLKNVLVASAHERGYCQGINFIAALFLLTEENEKDAYILLSYLLKHRYLDILFNSKCSSLSEYMKIFDKKLRKHNKLVYKHLKFHDFTTGCYAIEWFTTCYIVSCPGNLSSYVLDLIFADFDDILIRIGLSIMNYLENILLSMNNEDIHLNFKRLVMSIEPMNVIPQAILLNIGTSNNLLGTMITNIDKMSPNHELVDTLRSRDYSYIIGSDEETSSLTYDKHTSADISDNIKNKLNNQHNRNNKSNNPSKDQLVIKKSRYRKQRNKRARFLLTVQLNKFVSKHLYSTIYPLDKHIFHYLLYIYYDLNEESNHQLISDLKDIITSKYHEYISNTPVINNKQTTNSQLLEFVFDSMFNWSSQRRSHLSGHVDNQTDSMKNSKQSSKSNSKKDSKKSDSYLDSYTGSSIDKALHFIENNKQYDSKRPLIHEYNYYNNYYIAWNNYYNPNKNIDSTINNQTNEIIDNNTNNYIPKSKSMSPVHLNTIMKKQTLTSFTVDEVDSPLTTARRKSIYDRKHIHSPLPFKTPQTKTTQNESKQWWNTLTINPFQSLINNKIDNHIVKTNNLIEIPFYLSDDDISLLGYSSDDEDSYVYINISNNYDNHPYIHRSCLNVDENGYIPEDELEQQYECIYVGRRKCNDFESIVNNTIYKLDNHIDYQLNTQLVIQLDSQLDVSIDSKVVTDSHRDDLKSIVLYKEKSQVIKKHKHKRKLYSSINIVSDDEIFDNNTNSYVVTSNKIHRHIVFNPPKAFKRKNSLIYAKVDSEIDSKVDSKLESKLVNKIVSNVYSKVDGVVDIDEDDNEGLWYDPNKLKIRKIIRITNKINR